MTTKQNDTAALTDEQLEGVAGGSTSVGNPSPIGLRSSTHIGNPPPQPPNLKSPLRRAAVKGLMLGRLAVLNPDSM